MTRKLQKLLAVIGIGSVTLFQAGAGCDYLADQFLKGIEIGYQAETGESLFGTESSYDDVWEIDSFDDFSDCDYGCDLWW